MYDCDWTPRLVVPIEEAAATTTTGSMHRVASRTSDLPLVGESVSGMPSGGCAVRAAKRLLRSGHVPLDREELLCTGKLFAARRGKSRHADCRRSHATGRLRSKRTLSRDTLAATWRAGSGRQYAADTRKAPNGWGLPPSGTKRAGQGPQTVHRRLRQPRNQGGPRHRWAAPLATAAHRGALRSYQCGGMNTKRPAYGPSRATPCHRATDGHPASCAAAAPARAWSMRVVRCHRDRPEDARSRRSEGAERRSCCLHRRRGCRARELRSRSG
jgi:hypothetical protein